MNTATVFIFTDHGAEIVEKTGVDLNELKLWLLEMSKDKNPTVGTIVDGKFVIASGDIEGKINA